MRGGDYILMARRRAGLTQRQLAERIGLRQATIARWERGDRQVSIEDVQMVAAACGLHLDAHLVAEDRSWWSQIALQLELDPLERVRRLTPSDSSDLVSGLGELGAVSRPLVVIGEVAGALQGWPLVLSGDVIEICADRVGRESVAAAVGGRNSRTEHELQGGSQLRIVDAPPGTHGLHDLWRGADPIETPEGQLQVASVVDLLRIADASTRRSGRIEALAYQAVLDVQMARSRASARDGRPASERIERWLAQQSPVAT